MEIRFGELYTVTTKPTRVMQKGREWIHRRLDEVVREMALPIEVALPNDWDWSWMIQKGEFRGRLPKRIAGFYKRKYGIKLSSGTITYLGNIAKKYSHEAKTYTFDFTKSFDWMAGDFGDKDSCFWGARNLAREVLMMNGAIAIRFYSVNGDGIARAWIVENAETIIVFNAYGLPCKTISYVLSTLLNESHPQSVDMRIPEDLDDLMWLNGDARVIGTCPCDSIVTLPFDVPYRLCVECDEFVHEDNFCAEDTAVCVECTQF